MSAVMESPPLRSSITLSQRDPAKLSDQELIENVAGSGGGEHLTELLRRHYRRVERLATGILKNASEGQDVAQETFLAVHAHAGDCRSANVGAWIAAIAKRRCLDLLRRGRFMMPFDDHNLSAALSDPFLRIAVEEVLTELSPTQRICLRLHYWENRPYQEIAQITGLSDRTVKSHIQNGKARFKRLWKKSPSDGDLK